LERLSAEVSSHERELIERRNDCPPVGHLEDRVHPLEDANTSPTAAAATEKTDKAWMRYVWPIARQVNGLVLLLHAAEYLNMIK
jgi:hypothetical protein